MRNAPLLLVLAPLLVPPVYATAAPQEAPATVRSEPTGAKRIRAQFRKREMMIPMRDGVRLYTAIYTPRNPAQPFALLMRRTPYSCRPYGPDAYPERPGPSDAFADGRYGFVLQDVRGCYMSEGEFEDMRPHRPDKQPGETDESSDTWDTIQWLVENVEGHNGKVGMWGISYPGFYAATGMIDAHPALAAVSPQAPIADWWWDDFHHHGALFLPHAFLFFTGFGRPRPEPTTTRPRRIDPGTADGWRFFLELGPLSEAGERWMDGEVRFWDQAMAHPNRDAFWTERDLVPHLSDVAPAVMTVGGWFDAEDLYGPLAIYRSVEQRNPDAFNVLVMGPWSHGAWSRTSGEALGQARFGARTGDFYRASIEKPFFDHFLLGAGGHGLPEALLFDTGAGRWHGLEAWPPEELVERRLVLGPGGALALAEAAASEGGYEEFVSDPAKPVPHTSAIVIGMNREYMTEDQRFAARRPDVLVYETPPLEEDVTLAGPLVAELTVATTGTDADWIVKLVDVFPPDAPDPVDLPLEHGQRMSGYHMLVRGEVMAGRFREGFERPVPFASGEPATVRFELWDVLHTFREGHRIQVQVQSTWFPLVARNPQTFLDNPYTAREGDYSEQTHRVYHGSSLRVGVLPTRD
jgi:putative CocE/NonD family hydrolase